MLRTRECAAVRSCWLAAGGELSRKRCFSGSTQSRVCAPRSRCSMLPRLAKLCPRLSACVSARVRAGAGNRGASTPEVCVCDAVWCVCACARSVCDKTDVMQILIVLLLKWATLVGARQGIEVRPPKPFLLSHPRPHPPFSFQSSLARAAGRTRRQIVRAVVGWPIPPRARRCRGVAATPQQNGRRRRSKQRARRWSRQQR